MPGYPDFQAYPQWRTGNVATAYQQTLAPGNNVIYSAAVSYYGSMFLRVFPQSSSYCKITVAWYLDSAHTEGVGTDTWLCNTNSFLDVIIPIKATYVVVTLDNTAAVDWTGTTYISLLNVLTPEYKYPVAAQVITAAAVTLAASSSDYYYPSVLLRGPAMISFHPFDTSAKLDVFVNQTDETGAENGLLLNMAAPTAVITQLFYIPDVPLELKVQNLDSAASHKYTISMVMI